MTLADEFAALFNRELTKLIQELQAFPDETTLWRTCPGISNSAGNLALHLEGNLREFIGRQLGSVAYTRQRDLEFSATGVPAEQLVERIQSTRQIVAEVLPRLLPSNLNAEYPVPVLGRTISTQQFLIHVYGHLTYHLGQIDYLRRVLTGGNAVEFASL